MKPTNMRQLFVNFVRERELTRERRADGWQEIWSTDPIIQNYRFCNVNREHDAVTIWVKKFVRDPLRHAPLKDWLYNVYLARIFNEPKSMMHFMPIIPSPEGRKAAQQKVKALKGQGEKLLRGAYLCTTHGQKNVAVEDFYFNIAEQILNKKFLGLDSLQSVAEELMSIDGIGDFMANQVVTDLRYHLDIGNAFEDWETFVLAGPGTRRGINRYTFHNDHKVSRSASFYTERIIAIRDDLRVYFPDNINEHFRDPNNLSNCFCEFDKYCRARDQQALGERITLRPFKRK